MKTWLFFILALIVSDSFANDLYVDVHLASYHFNRDGYYQGSEQHDWNEKNFGLGLTYQYHENVQLMGGFFKNSYYRNSPTDNPLLEKSELDFSWYVGANFHANYKYKGINIKPGILLGGVTGYDDTPLAESHSWVGTITPMVIPNISIGTENLLVNFGLVPIDDMGVTLSLKIKL